MLCLEAVGHKEAPCNARRGADAPERGEGGMSCPDTEMIQEIKAAVRWHPTPTNLTLLSARSAFMVVFRPQYTALRFTASYHLQCLQNIFYVLTLPRFINNARLDLLSWVISCPVYGRLMFTFIVYLLFVVLLLIAPHCPSHIVTFSEGLWRFIAVLQQRCSFRTFIVVIN